MDEAGAAALDLDRELVAPDGKVVWSTGAFNDPTGSTVAEHDPLGSMGNHTEEPLFITADYLDMFSAYTIVLKPYTSIEGDYKITVTFS